MVYSVNLFGDDHWAVVIVNRDGSIRTANEKAVQYFGPVTGKNILMAFPWFREEWLSNKVHARVIKTSPYNKILMDIVKKGDQGQTLLFFKNVDEYRNLNHLWCEIGDSLIMLQPFIDNSHDGIVITNGQGTVRATNQAFCEISGLTEEDILGSSVFDLCKQGLIPECSMMHTLERNQMESSVTKFPRGREAIVSSKPLCNKQGEIIRVLSNVRDLTEIEELQKKVQSAEAMAKHFRHEFNAKVATEKLDFGHHQSPRMEELYELVKKVADTDLPLLITGESGVGKTALAKHIHKLSERNTTGAFVHINCSAIPETLLESELFGFEAGSFSGAGKTKVGLFEIAQKGTIFLDEIGDMPLTLQAKLLNVLQEKKFYRLGGTKTIDTDARVFAATNHNLQQMIAEGRFRQDLFFRLNVIPVAIPALRDRREDIVPMIAHIVAEINDRYHCSKTLAPDTLLTLEAYEWPGNIRELKNVIERTVVLTREDVIELHHLPPEVRGLQKMIMSPAFVSGALAVHREKTKPLWNPGEQLKAAVNHAEAQIIEQAITLYGSVKAAAKKLGVDESTITRKRRKVNQTNFKQA